MKFRGYRYHNINKYSIVYRQCLSHHTVVYYITIIIALSNCNTTFIFWTENINVSLSKALLSIGIRL